LSNCPRVVHKASRVRAAALRSSVLSLAKKRSIGLMGSHRGQDRDGAQIGRVEPAPDLIRGRQVEEAGSGGEDGLAPAFHLVGGEIVEDHHVTGPELGDQNLLALQAEDRAGHGSVDHDGRHDAGLAQPGHEGGGAPVALRSGIDQPLAAWSQP
jgi:hypothetical protein